MSGPDPVVTQAAGKARRYRAFLSYSHADERAASSLHRWLEGYRIPARLVGETTARGPVERYVSPIFRDRAELPAASSLNAEVEKALEASDALLVLCSPDAAASRWVNAEISLFRRLHPERPVVAALLRGEPEESFPPAMLMPGPDGTVPEPIAADFRPDKDGPQLARLKIVAGLSGLGLDQLIQRDAQRQLRRVIGITALAVLLALLMALLLLFAIRAKREADEQRRQAEGLIEFMLTDLRDRLKGVGRLDVLDTVNQRAIEYYADQSDLDSLPADSLERRARILHAMGEDDHRHGDVAAAQIKFAEAARATAALLAANPRDPVRIFGHAQSEFWLGYLKFMQKRPKDALPHFRAYQDLARKLVEVQPGESKYWRELAYAQGNLCTVALDNEDLANLLGECRNALDTMLRVRKMEPDDPAIAVDLANRYAWNADALRKQGDDRGALAQRKEQMKINEALLKSDPKNAEYRQGWMLAMHSTSLVYYALGEKDLARSLRDRARAEVARLIAQDPDNADWKSWRRRLSLPWPEVKKSN